MGNPKREVRDVSGYMDFDFAGDLDRRKSISRYLFIFDSYFVSWKSTLQPIVALSSIEEELVTATEAVKESICLKGI